MPRRGENIYKRKDGRWEGRYRIGHDQNGNLRYRSVYGKSYQAVKDRLINLKSQIASKQYRPSGRVTVNELFTEWFTAIQNRVKASTFANYRLKADKHILPAFGRTRYENLTPNLLHAFITEKIGSGLSPKYVSDIVIVFKSMAKYITRIHGFRNPIADVMLPKTERSEMRLLSDTQQKQLSGYLRQHLDHTSLCVMLSLYTGLRIGEICGLKWLDIDFQKQTLTVSRTVQRIRSGNATKLLIDKPKSRSSQRVIPLPAFLMEILDQNQKESEHYVLSGSRNVTEPRTMQNRFHSILKKANLPSINYHSLRHMFATNCIQAGFDVKTLSEILGHAAVETTLSRYVHSSFERKTLCMNMLRP